MQSSTAARRDRVYFQVSLLAIALLLFVVIPLIMIVAVSFFTYDMVSGSLPSLILDNFIEVFTDRNTLNLYGTTLKYAAIVWALTLFIGFWIAYFLAFHVRNLLIAIGLFLVCTVPFWTSNVIRMISWIPLLGKEGLFNQALLGLGIVSEPVEWFLFSDFAVILCYVNLFTLFMIVPIFNSMARIDRSLIEAARDAGAGRLRIMTEVVVPLSKSGIALGSVFVIALTMGDFFVVKIMSGGRSANVVSAMFDDISILNYPHAGAQAVVLLIVVTLIVTAIMRIVDVRNELAQAR
jgi:putative spermidine/putrescine transport system permease protein